MKRREFITLLGSAAAWPLAAQAQQRERLRRIVFVHPLAENDPEIGRRITVFREGMEALGWREGRNIQIEHRFLGADLSRMQICALELVASAPDLIVSTATAVILPLKQATQTIPIVFALLADPVGTGVVASLARPGGNITGFLYFEFSILGKWLEMLKEIAPTIRRIGFMFGPPAAPWAPLMLREFGAVPASLAVEFSEIPVHDDAEIEAAVGAFAREPGGGLMVAPEPFMNAHRGLVMALAEQHRFPAIYGFRQFVKEGALISYGPDSADIVRRSASYVDRVLKGEKPADLPVQAPTKYELLINLRTAKALGLTVPLTLLALADEVIE